MHDYKDEQGNWYLEIPVPGKTPDDVKIEVWEDRFRVVISSPDGAPKHSIKGYDGEVTIVPKPGLRATAKTLKAIVENGLLTIYVPAASDLRKRKIHRHRLWQSVLHRLRHPSTG